MYPAQRRYPPEPKERAVRMVREATKQSGESFGVIIRVARQLGNAGGIAAQLGQTGRDRRWSAARDQHR